MEVSMTAVPNGVEAPRAEELHSVPAPAKVPKVEEPEEKPMLEIYSVSLELQYSSPTPLAKRLEPVSSHSPVTEPGQTVDVAA